MDEQSGPVRYGAWSADRQGWFLGLSGPAWILIIGAGSPLLFAVAARDWRWAVGWLPVWAAVTVAVALPVRGRTAARWLLDAAVRGFGVAMGWTDWQSRAAAGSVTDPGEADLPGVLSGIVTFDGPPYGPLLARPVIIADNRARTWAVVARLAHPGIALAQAGDRARMADGFSELLEAAATAGLVSLVAVQVRTIPDDGAERAVWLSQNRASDAPEPALAVTEDLGQVMQAAGVRHEAFVTVVVPEHRIARQAREAGGGVDGRARVLHGVMGQIEAALYGPVGATAVTWLDAPGLAAAIRTGFAPGERAGLVAAEIAGRGDPGVVALPMAAAGPTRTPPPGGRCYVHDAWATATCTILLPDKGALMGALAPVLAPSTAGERRCLTAFFEPIGHARAEKMVGGQAMTSDLAADLRRRSGFAERAAHRRAAARVAGQDERLADGSALVRVAAAAAVTVPAEWSISDYGRRLEASITGSGFTPLRLDLAQDTGFAAACIPLGVGLPARRGIGG